jgi:FkbM family methyltransferase
MKNLKAALRSVTPKTVRQWYQRRQIDGQTAAYSKRVVEHRYGNAKLKVEIADPLAEAWYDRDWRGLPPEVQIFGWRRFKPGARVFDCGAHQGVLGLTVAHFVGSVGQVILVEPNPHNVRQCRRNIELNAMPWATPHQAAIGDREGALMFNNAWNGAAAELNDYGGAMEVALTTINALVDQYGAPDVVYLDIEGFEARALTAADRAFAANPLWFIEVHVGCGLEQAGDSAERVLSFFPEERCDRWIGDPEQDTFYLFNEAPPGILDQRFFLIAAAKES